MTSPPRSEYKHQPKGNPPPFQRGECKRVLIFYPCFRMWKLSDARDTWHSNNLCKTDSRGGLHVDCTSMQTCMFVTQYDIQKGPGTAHSGLRYCSNRRRTRTPYLSARLRKEVRVPKNELKNFADVVLTIHMNLMFDINMWVGGGDCDCGDH